eukprot:gene8736-10357_t
MEVDARNPRSEDIYDLNKQFDKDEGKIELDKFVNEAERVHEKTERHLIQDLDMELKNSISNGFQSDLFSSQPTDTALNEKLRSHWNSVRCSAWEMCAATIGVLGSYIGVGEAFTGASQLYQAGMHHRRDILQNRLYHRQAYAQADRHHKEGLNFETEIYKQNWRWHKESIIWGMNEAEAHLRQVINDMREAHKEADRDLFDQHNMQLQSLSTVSTLLLASGFALVVEGRLPAHPGTLLDVDPEYVVIAYYASLGIAIVFMSTSLLCGIWYVTSAFVLGTFMIMQALVFYVIAHLCGDEPDTGEAQSVTAALVFCSALALFLVMLCLMFAIKMLFPRNPEPKNPFNVMKVLKNAEKLFGNFHKLSLVIQNQHGTQETGVKMSVFAAVLGIGQNGAAGGNSEAAAAEGVMCNGDHEVLE